MKRAMEHCDDTVMEQCNDKNSRSEEHTSELQSHHDLVCRLLLEKSKKQHRNRKAQRNRRYQEQCKLQNEKYNNLNKNTEWLEQNGKDRK